MLDIGTVLENDSSNDTTVNMQEKKGMKSIDKLGFINPLRGVLDKSEGSVLSPPILLEF